MTTAERVAFWSCVNEYAAACEGDSGAVNDRRMAAVAALERLVGTLEHKNDWIEVNLPWYKDFEGPAHDAHQKAYWDAVALVEDRARKVFGATRQEAFDNSRLIGADPDHINDITAHVVFDEEIRDDDWLRRVESEFHGDEEIIGIARYWHFIYRYDAWWAEQPEWNETDELLCRAVQEHKASCFCDSPACRPGVQIEVRTTEGGIGRYLIGDINANGGVCNDCRAFDKKSIVLRYREVFSYDGAGNV